MKAFIKKIDQLNANQSVAVIQLVHAPGENISDNFGAIVSASCDREYLPVPGASSVLMDGKTSTYVRALLTRMQDVIPVTQMGDQFTALSRNMYMDREERMWAVEKSESGEDMLVRQSDSRDNADLITMIRSVSGAGGLNMQATLPEVATALYRHEAILAAADGGDMISYVSASGALKIGFVAGRVTDDNSFLVVDENGVQEQIVSASMVAILPADEIDEKQCPPVDSVSAAAGVTTEKLLDYYGKVYRYSPEYFSKLAAIIRNYSF